MYRMWGGGDRWCMAGARARSRTHGRRCVRPRRLRRLVPNLLRGLRGSPARDGRRHPGSCWPFCVRPLEALHVPRVPRRPARSPSPTTMPFLQSTGRAMTRSGGRWEQRRTRTTCPLAKMVALIAHGDDRPAATPPSTSPTSLLLLHLPLLRLYPGGGATRHETPPTPHSLSSRSAPGHVRAGVVVLGVLARARPSHVHGHEHGYCMGMSWARHG